VPPPSPPPPPGKPFPLLPPLSAAAVGSPTGDVCRLPPKPVAAMTATERFTEVLTRTAPKLPGEIREEFAAILTPTSLAIMAGTLAAWGASHYFGVGFVFDLLLLVGGVLLLGWQVWSACSDLVAAIKGTATAKTDADLEAAAGHLANFVAVVGVATFQAVLMKGAKTAAPAVSSRIAMASGRMAGMLPAHFQAVLRVAREQKMIIAFRNTNPLARKWIELGFPGKPMSVKIKSSRTTGIVTATTPEEIRAARFAGFYVVDSDGVARIAPALSLPLKDVNWPVEKGQVIHPDQLKPLVGDYDLLGVIDPTAPGRNIVLASENGVEVADRTNPIVKRVAAAINAQLDQPRVLHGAWDSFDDAGKAGGATVFFPDGTVLELNRSEFVAAWYQWMGRQSVIK
jgi:hypothetical protein